MRLKPLTGEWKYQITLEEDARKTRVYLYVYEWKWFFWKKFPVYFRETAYHESLEPFEEQLDRKVRAIKQEAIAHMNQVDFARKTIRNG